MNPSTGSNLERFFFKCVYTCKTYKMVTFSWTILLNTSNHRQFRFFCTLLLVCPLPFFFSFPSLSSFFLYFPMSMGKNKISVFTKKYTLTSGPVLEQEYKERKISQRREMDGSCVHVWLCSELTQLFQMKVTWTNIKFDWHVKWLLCNVQYIMYMACLQLQTLIESFF